MIYLRPWELEPGQARHRSPWLSVFRHYVNPSGAEAKFRRLLRGFPSESPQQALRAWDTAFSVGTAEADIAPLSRLLVSPARVPDRSWS